MKQTNSFFRRLALMAFAVLGGIHVEPVTAQTAPGVTPLPTSETALVGRFARGPMNWPIAVAQEQFGAEFGSTNSANWPAEIQARQFFAHGGAVLHVVRVSGTGSLTEALRGDAARWTGLHALTRLSDLRILIAPELTRVAPSDFTSLLASCRGVLEASGAFLILDPPEGMANASSMIDWVQDRVPAGTGWAAVYYPYLEVTFGTARVRIGASGAMAGLYTRHDEADGIWSSPAGGALSLQAEAIFPILSTADSDQLNQNHVCPIREFAGLGIVPWGARTLERVNHDDRFIAPSRTRAWIEATLERDLAFAAVEQNDETLWASIRLRAESFLLSLYQQGAFAGAQPDDAFFVRCDAGTTSLADIAAHRVNLVYGLAMLRPEEFSATTMSGLTWDEDRVPSPTPLYWRRWKGALQLVYPTAPGFQFEIESSSSIPIGPWNEEVSRDPGDGAWRRVELPIAVGENYYRLRISGLR